MAALQPDGVVLTPPHSDNPLIVDLLGKMKIPFARIGSLGGEAGIALTMDDEGSAQIATRHLIDLGHRRIGFIAGSAVYNLSGWRVQGWREGMEAAGRHADGLLVAGACSSASGQEAARTLLDSPDPAAPTLISNHPKARK